MTTHEIILQENTDLRAQLAAANAECERLKAEAPYALLRAKEKELFVAERDLGETKRLLDGDAKIRARIVAERDALRQAGKDMAGALENFTEKPIYTREDFEQAHTALAAFRELEKGGAT